MASLRITAGNHNEPLSDAETVRLGRLLTRELSVQHVGFPVDSSGIVIVIHSHDSVLAPELADKVERIIGKFDQVVEDDQST